jgi:hypothetical protein
LSLLVLSQRKLINIEKYFLLKVLGRSFSTLNLKRKDKSQVDLFAARLNYQPNYAISLNDSRNFASLAWFGLWGKAPKPTEVINLST